MANYTAEASYIIPCNSVQANLALYALKQIDFNITRYAEYCLGENAGHGSIASIIRHCVLNHPEYDADKPETLDDVYLSFRCEIDKKGLWISHDESIISDHAAIFTQAVLTAFDIDAFVVIDIAYTCSRPVLDAFAGDTVIVTKDEINYLGTFAAKEAYEKAHTNQAHYFSCSIVLAQGDKEFKERFLMTCGKKEDDSEVFDQLIEGYYGEGNGFFENDLAISYPDGITGKEFNYTPITPADFAVMENHLPVHALG